MKVKTIVKQALKWLLITAAAHLIAFLLFAVILGDATYQMAFDNPDDLSAPIISTLAFDLAFVVFFAVGFEKFWGLPSSEKAALKTLGKDPTFSLLRYFVQKHGKNAIYAAALSLLFQLPFFFFFNKYGFVFVESVFLERFYVLDAGAYLFLPHSALALLLNALWFALTFSAVRFVSVWKASRDD